MCTCGTSIRACRSIPSPTSPSSAVALSFARRNCRCTQPSARPGRSIARAHRRAPPAKGRSQGGVVEAISSRFLISPCSRRRPGVFRRFSRMSWTACWRNRRIARPTGKSVTKKSTIAASSISTNLVALRIELPEVFDNAGRKTLELVHSGKVTGLRIDHIDGLWDPEAVSLSACKIRRVRVIRSTSWWSKKFQAAMNPSCKGMAGKRYHRMTIFSTP